MDPNLREKHGQKRDIPESSLIFIKFPKIFIINMFNAMKKNR
jgi:hypothetical protein